MGVRVGRAKVEGGSHPVVRIRHSPVQGRGLQDGELGGSPGEEQTEASGSRRSLPRTSSWSTQVFIPEAEKPTWGVGRAPAGVCREVRADPLLLFIL